MWTVNLFPFYKVNSNMANKSLEGEITFFAEYATGNQASQIVHMQINYKLGFPHNAFCKLNDNVNIKVIDTKVYNVHTVHV